MKYDLALKVVANESNEQTAARIVELYECITTESARRIAAEDVLQWYVDKNNWQWDGDGDMSIAQDEWGQRARDHLAKYPDNEEADHE